MLETSWGDGAFILYHKIAGSRLVYYSIFDHFIQRSQYILKHQSFMNSLKITQCATNQYSLLIVTLRQCHSLESTSLSIIFTSRKSIERNGSTSTHLTNEKYDLEESSEFLQPIDDRQEPMNQRIVWLKSAIKVAKKAKQIARKTQI